MSVVVSAHREMEKAWLQQPHRLWTAELGFGSSTWGTCDQDEAAPLLSSQGMLLQKPGLVGGSFSLVTWESARDNWGSDGDL